MLKHDRAALPFVCCRHFAAQDSMELLFGKGLGGLRHGHRGSHFGYGIAIKGRVRTMATARGSSPRRNSRASK